LIDFKYIKKIIEALLFASDVPLATNRILKVIEDIKESDVSNAIDELNRDYGDTGRSFRVSKIGGGYQLVTVPEFSKYIKSLYKHRARSRLSHAALEALSIVAFKQPISRPEIDQIRGVNSDGVVRTLLERNLITIAGRSEAVGKALLYGTTPEFLRYFGINEISELPKPKELEELLGSTQEELQFPTEEEKTEIIEKLTALDNPENSDDQVK
jgi:segregation and condensation protein B